MPVTASKSARRRSRTPTKPVRRAAPARNSATFSNVQTRRATVFWRYATPLLVGAVSFVCIWLFIGRWFRISFDEGIYLVGAQSVASGLAPYKDFFAITGPGTFWMYGTLFKLIGPSYTGAHILLYFEVSAIAAAIFLLVSWAARSRLAAGISAAFYLAITTFNQLHLLVNHRWDSLCFIAFGTVLLAHAAGSINTRPPSRRACAACAGILAGAACLATPTVFVAFLGAIAWLRIKRRDFILPYSLGFTLTGLLAVAALAKSSALPSALAMFAWNQQHYGRANAVWFGWFHVDPSVWNHNVALIAISLGIAFLPSVFPILTVALCGYAKWKAGTKMGDVAQLSLVIGLCMLLASYPRVASSQLLFALPFFFAPFASQIISAKKLLWRKAVAVLAAAAAIVTICNVPTPPLQDVQTGAGMVQCTPSDARIFHDLQQLTPPGAVALAYPYLPILYSVSGTKPPGYYSFLQPGMMGPVDEARALGDLNRTRPAVVFWRRLTPEHILQLWPNSDRRYVAFPAIERFIVENYARQETAKLPVEVWLPRNH
jgi:hypothetical protein